MKTEASTTYAYDMIQELMGGESKLADGLGELSDSNLELARQVFDELADRIAVDGNFAEAVQRLRSVLHNRQSEDESRNQLSKAMRTLGLKTPITY